MISTRTLRCPPASVAEAWWPLQDVASTASRWHAEHVTSGWWDPGDGERTRLRHAAALVDELLASLPNDAPDAGARLLELGCGPGTGLQEVARRRAYELHAWDASPDARSVARGLAPDAAIHDDLALGLADSSVDVVWVPRSLARGGEDWAQIVAEAHRVLRPGGLLAAVLAGPGVWVWEERPDAWDEERTGLLVLGLDRPDARGGPLCFTSRWWRDEHVGRGFATVLVRPAGVAMPHPDQGFGLTVWRRREGPALSAAQIAAVAPGDVREGLALQRQLALAHAEARARAARDEAARTAVLGRSAALAGPAAVDGHPRVRDALTAVAALEAEVLRLRDRPQAPGRAATLRAIGDWVRAARGGTS